MAIHVLVAVLFCIGCSSNSANDNDDAGPPPDAGTVDGGIDGGDTDSGDRFHRVIAIGDHHGDLDQTLAALRTAGVIDEHENWIGGDTHVVQTGDILDRGDHERGIIDLYEELRSQAEAEGGSVTNLNGNHEIMTAYGDYRYVTEGACSAFADIEGLDTDNPAFAELSEACKMRAAAFWPGGPYARIISNWPMVFQLQDSIFVHGGLHQTHLDYGLETINAMTESWLLGEGTLDYTIVGGGAGAVDWDRTYGDFTAPPSDDDCAALESVLGQLNASRLIVGHSVQYEINSACDGLVWRIDVGMAAYYGGSVAVLEITADGQLNVLQDLTYPNAD